MDISPDEFRPSDKLTALDKLFRHLGMFSKDNASQVAVAVTAAPLSDIEIAQWLALMLAKGMRAQTKGNR